MNEEHSTPGHSGPETSRSLVAAVPLPGWLGCRPTIRRLLAEIKARTKAARTRAVLAVNSELIRLYWEIGHQILYREQREG